MENVTIIVAPEITEVTLTVSELPPNNTGGIPPQIEQRIQDLEEFKLNGTINGGIIF